MAVVKCSAQVVAGPRSKQRKRLRTEGAPAPPSPSNPVGARLLIQRRPGDRMCEAPLPVPRGGAGLSNLLSSL